MNYFITDFIKSIFFSFKASVLVVFSAYALICFIVALIIKLRLKKRVDKVYIVFCFSGLALLLSVLSAIEIKLFYALFTCFFYVFLCLVFYGITCFFNAKSDQEILDEFIDKEIDKPLIIEDVKPKEVDLPFNDVQTETDFTHVKNVIDRLSYYPLTQTDNRQIRELKEAVFFAEKDGITDPLREKINDGLSALLKIMSKHGV